MQGNEQLIENAGNPFLIPLNVESAIVVMIIYSIDDGIWYQILKSDRIWGFLELSSEGLFPTNLEVLTTLDFDSQSELLIAGDTTGNINMIKLENETLELLSSGFQLYNPSNPKSKYNQIT